MERIIMDFNPIFVVTCPLIDPRMLWFCPCVQDDWQRRELISVRK